MIIMFGSAGSGKSIQGQLLAARHGWRWLASGQIFRDLVDDEAMSYIKKGELVPDEITNRIVFRALDRAYDRGDIAHVILDGYPRTIEQAKALIDHEKQRNDGSGVSMCIVLEVPRDEALKRLTQRGREEDDQLDAIERRLQIYRSEIYPLLNFFNELGVPIVHVDGVGSVGEVHDRIESEIVSYNIVPSLDEEK